MNEILYYGTVAWNGFETAKDGSETTIANDLESLISGIELSLKDYKNRDAYFECASWELEEYPQDPYEPKTYDYSYKDITDLIKSKLKTRRTNGK